MSEYNVTLSLIIAGSEAPCRYDKTRMCRLFCENHGVGGCDPPRGGIP